jgi:hypothetical protein
MQFMSIVTHDPVTSFGSHESSQIFETHQMNKTLDSPTIFRFFKEDNISDLNIV